MNTDVCSRPVQPVGLIDRLRPLEIVAVAVMAPVFVSAVLFQTYDISMTSLTAEIYRHFNAPFLIAEAIVIALAAVSGFRLNSGWLRLTRSERSAAIVFVATFWLGGIYASAMPPFAALFNLTFVLHIVFLAAVFDLAQRSSYRDIGIFVRIFLICLAVFTVLIAIRFTHPPAGRAVETIQWQFAVPGMISVRLLGAWLAPIVALFCAVALFGWRDQERRSWALCGVVLASGLLAWSGTRAGVVAVAASALIYVAYFRARPLGRPLVLTGLASLAGAIVGMCLVPYGDPSFLLFDWADVESADSISGGRLDWWIALVKAYLHSPIIGFGPGSSSYLAGPGFAPHVQPHNFVIEFFLNWGAIAACAALYLLARLMIAAHRAGRRNPAAVPFVLMADALLIVGLFDGTLHFAQHLMLFAAALGIALAYGQADSLEQPDAASR